jgi:hypothetical protein
MTPLVFGSVAPCDDVRGARADLLIASGASVLFARGCRLDLPDDPSGRRCYLQIGSDDRFFFWLSAASLRVRAPRAHAIAPPSITMAAPVT